MLYGSALVTCYSEFISVRPITQDEEEVVQAAVSSHQREQKVQQNNVGK
jgi:hypothetical protein